MGLKEDMIKAGEEMKKALTDPWELECLALTGKIEEFVGEDGKLDWQSIKKAAFVDKDTSRVKIAGAISISGLDGDNYSFTSDDKAIEENREFWEEKLKAQVKTGLSVRQQWISWWTNAAEFAKSLLPTL